MTLHCGAEEADSIARRLSEICTLITVDGVDWNRELSPWKAEKVFRGEEDFAREADQYLKELTGQILPAAETAAGIHPFKRVIAGYSMRSCAKGRKSCSPAKADSLRWTGGTETARCWLTRI